MNFLLSSARWGALLQIVVLCFTMRAVGAAPPQIIIAYPPNNKTVAFDHVLLSGSVPRGASLKINNRVLDVAPDGLFIEWWPLEAGENLIALESTQGSEVSKRELRVTRTISRLPDTFSVDADSITPKTDLNLFTLDGSLWNRTISVSFRGSTGAIATFKIGDKGPFPLTESATQNGSYNGSHVLRDNEVFDRAPITIQFADDKQTVVEATPKGTVTVSADKQPRVGVITAEPIGLGVNASTTAIRNGVGRSPVLQLQKGTKFIIVGEEGDTYRCALSSTQTVNVLKTQMELLPNGTPLPRVYFSRIETRKTTASRTRNATQVRFSLPERVPFQIEQIANDDEQTLDVRLFDTEADVDYMTSAFPDELVKSVTWRQEGDGVFLARIVLRKAQQWGFFAQYEGNTLVITVKDKPPIARRNPLRGLRILVDAGHGGKESGAPGALGVDEKDLNLRIALLLAENLKKRGAEVILSRTEDVTLPLYDRTLLAEKTNADILISVHGNALPDGVDPKTQRGAGAYYFQPQARVLAETLLGSMLKDIPEVGNDGVHYQNLALTRPSTQLSILVETGFLTDKGNVRLLMSERGQRRFADSLARGLEEFARTTLRKSHFQSIASLW